MIKAFREFHPSVPETAYVSKSALVMGQGVLGEYSGIWPGAVIRGDFARIEIGEATIIEDNCVVHAGGDMIIGEHVIVGHGAVVHGERVGDRTLVANNATILDGSVVGNFCIIGAGAVVSPGSNIPDHSLVFGVPGKVVGQVKAHQKARLLRGNDSYRLMFEAYREADI